MPNERQDQRDEPLLEPEDVNSAPRERPAAPDPNDEIPVPIAMFPAEIDERAQVVEALREEERNAEAAERKSSNGDRSANEA